MWMHLVSENENAESIHWELLRNPIGSLKEGSSGALNVPKTVCLLRIII